MTEYRQSGGQFAGFSATVDVLQCCLRDRWWIDTTNQRARGDGMN